MFFGRICVLPRRTAIFLPNKFRHFQQSASPFFFFYQKHFFQFGNRCFCQSFVPVDEPPLPHYATFPCFSCGSPLFPPDEWLTWPLMRISPLVVLAGFHGWGGWTKIDHHFVLQSWHRFAYICLDSHKDEKMLLGSDDGISGVLRIKGNWWITIALSSLVR